MNYTITDFGLGADLITISHEDIIITFSNLGARMNDWRIDNHHLVLGFDNAQHAKAGHSYYYGASIGRIAGRITHGQFYLNEEPYQLSLNEGSNHLHGGPEGFDSQLFSYTISQDESGIAIQFNYTDPDGHNGYPGQLELTITHRYTTDHRWTVSYQATSDQDTLFNPTNHVYFNLNGRVDKPITNHVLTIPAEQYIPVKANGLPVGQKVNVEGTTFDLRIGQRLADAFALEDPQVTLKNGFDHPFILDNNKPIRLSLPEQGISIEATTDCDSVVVYTHGSTDPAMAIWDIPLEIHAGITLETQQLPDAINQENFGNTILKANERYYSETSYQLIK